MAIYENRDQLSKFNPVPHRAETSKILDEIKVKRQRSIKYHETSTVQKNLTIMKENQVLLSKLVEVVGRKKSITLPTVAQHTNSTLKKSRAATSQSLARSQRTMTICPVAHPTIMNYSLNGTWRKKEYDRIERENHAFASRLFMQKSDVSKKLFDTEYKQTKRYKKIIKRVDAS